MKQYQKSQGIILLIALAYASIGLTSWATKSPEIFPFFSWDLFSSVPQPVASNYGLRIHEVDGQILHEPIYFEHADRFFRNAKSIEAFTLIQNLGHAISTRNTTEAETIRQMLEMTHLQDASTLSYEVVFRRFDVIERWQGKPFLEEIPMALYEIKSALP